MQVLNYLILIILIILSNYLICYLYVLQECDMLVEDIKIIKRFYISGNPILNYGNGFFGKKQCLRLFIKLGQLEKRGMPNYKYLHLTK